MNWVVTGLNWTLYLKCLEMTIVVTWHYINKTELNLIHKATSYGFTLFNFLRIYSKTIC